MKQSIKLFLEKYFPRLRYAITSFNNRRIHKKHQGAFQSQIRQKLFGKKEPTVLSGPFAGIFYIDDIVWGRITTKWLGSYECELHPVLNAIIKEQQYESIVDVGAAEGYYAIGLAKHLPKSTVYAFDLDFYGRRQQHHLAKINQVENLVIGFHCTALELQNCLKGISLLVCDIEGFEVQLLNPVQVPKLRNTDILVEIHRAGDMSAEEVRDILKERFQDSHEIEVLEGSERELVKYRNLAPLNVSDEELLTAMEEGRSYRQYWLWMRSRD